MNHTVLNWLDGIVRRLPDKVAFTDAILNLYKNRMCCEELGRNGRQFVLDNLTKAVGTQKYIDVIKSFNINKKDD